LSLKWINDKVLIDAVQHVLTKAREAKISSEKEFGKNIIDPFSALFEITGFDLNFKSWQINETARQAQKTLQNHVGEFHQKILGSVSGWEDLQTGKVIDLTSKKKKIVAEVKNKFNTVKGSNQIDIYNDLENLVMSKTSIYYGYTAYYVVIIPKSSKRFDKEFTPSDNKKGIKCSINPKIRQIDGASFYDLATGGTNTLGQLFNYLPILLKEQLGIKVSAADFQELSTFFKKAFD